VQLQQVFMNLMLNGIEAMKDTGGELTIHSEATEHEQLLISIKDTGVGLPRNNLTRSSVHSLPRSPKGPAWGSRSAGPSSSRMAAACGRAPTQEKAPRFVLRCPRAESGAGMPYRKPVEVEFRMVVGRQNVTN